MSSEFFNNLIWMTTKEASEYLRLSPEALRIQVHRGKIPFSKLGRRLRFKREDLDKLLITSNQQNGGYYDN